MSELQKIKPNRPAVVTAVEPRPVVRPRTVSAPPPIVARPTAGPAAALLAQLGNVAPLPGRPLESGAQPGAADAQGGASKNKAGAPPDHACPATKKGAPAAASGGPAAADAQGGADAATKNEAKAQKQAQGSKAGAVDADTDLDARPKGAADTKGGRGGDAKNEAGAKARSKGQPKAKARAPAGKESKPAVRRNPSEDTTRVPGGRPSEATTKVVLARDQPTLKIEGRGQAKAAVPGPDLKNEAPKARAADAPDLKNEAPKAPAADAPDLKNEAPKASVADAPDPAAKNQPPAGPDATPGPKKRSFRILKGGGRFHAVATVINAGLGAANAAFSKSSAPEAPPSPDDPHQGWEQRFWTKVYSFQAAEPEPLGPAPEVNDFCGSEVGDWATHQVSKIEQALVVDKSPLARGAAVGVVRGVPFLGAQLSEDTAVEVYNTAVSTAAELARGSLQILKLGEGTAQGLQDIKNAEDNWGVAIGVARIIADVGNAAGAVAQMGSGTLAQKVVNATVR